MDELYDMELLNDSFYARLCGSPVVVGAYAQSEEQAEETREISSSCDKCSCTSESDGRADESERSEVRDASSELSFQPSTVAADERVDAGLLRPRLTVAQRLMEHRRKRENWLREAQGKRDAQLAEEMKAPSRARKHRGSSAGDARVASRSSLERLVRPTKSSTARDVSVNAQDGPEDAMTKESDGTFSPRINERSRFLKQRGLNEQFRWERDRQERRRELELDAEAQLALVATGRPQINPNSRRIAANSATRMHGLPIGEALYSSRSRRKPSEQASYHEVQHEQRRRTARDESSAARRSRSQSVAKDVGLRLYEDAKERNARAQECERIMELLSAVDESGQELFQPKVNLHSSTSRGENVFEALYRAAEARVEHAHDLENEGNHTYRSAADSSRHLPSQHTHGAPQRQFTPSSTRTSTRRVSLPFTTERSKENVFSRLSGDHADSRRLRANVDDGTKELTFKPRIDRHSVRIDAAGGLSGQERIEWMLRNQEAAERARELQRESGGSESNHSREPFGRGSARPSRTSSDVVERIELWAERKERVLGRHRLEAMREEVSECTFRPRTTLTEVNANASNAFRKRCV